MDWHTLTAEEVAQHWQVDPARGLDEAVVRQRLAEYGPNTLPAPGRRSSVLALAAQFTNAMSLALALAAAVAFAMGERANGSAILAILVLNGLLGFYQEYRAERALQAIRELGAPCARVLRGGEALTISAESLVPGDIILLEAGDVPGADARIVEAHALEVNEAALTGESLPVVKAVKPLPAAAIALGDRVNMVYQGTVVTKGWCKAVVVATGPRTEMGRIAALSGWSDSARTPLQIRLDRLGRFLILVSAGIAVLVGAIGLWRGEPTYQVFMTAVSLAVAAVPEGLPAVVTIVLALGVQRMARRRAIVRRLTAVETLGCTTFICSDKTGTLTENRMTVQAVYAGGRVVDMESMPEPAAEDVLAALEVAAVCNDAGVARASPGGASKLPGSGGGVVRGDLAFDGDPMEVALLAAAIRAGLDVDGLRQRWFRVGELPFDPDRRMMSVLCRNDSGAYRLFTKGAPERVLSLCEKVLDRGRVAAMDEASRERTEGVLQGLAKEGMRLLAVAYRDVGAEASADEWASWEKGLVFCGVLALVDPPRPEVKDSLSRCREAGIRVAMVTGDHAVTAKAIAARCGIEGDLLTGKELDDLSDEELSQRAESTGIYARISPFGKLRIVRALRAGGHVVAVTGDGVNDVPALEEADIGVAMGRGGTEAARGAADIVLTDDNFATIVAAVEEGRTIYANIQRFVAYLLACNMGEVALIILAGLAGLEAPLSPVQILFINLITDGLPAIALGLDPPGLDLMRRPPRRKSDGLLPKRVWLMTVIRGVLMGLASLLAFMLSASGSVPGAVMTHEGGLAHARTLTMTVLVLSQLLFAFESRFDAGRARGGLWGNRYLVWAAAASLLVMGLVIYLPPAAGFLGSTPLGPSDLALAFALALSGAAGGWVMRRGVWKAHHPE